MKLVILFFCLFCFFSSCKCKKSITENTAVSSQESTVLLQKDILPNIIYQETARGSHRKISISEGTIYVVSAQGAKPVYWMLNKADNQNLLELFQKIDLDKINTLKSPTEKRFYDGAPIANLTFSTKKNTYISSDFDGGFPPKEINAFVNALIEIAEKLNN